MMSETRVRGTLRSPNRPEDPDGAHEDRPQRNEDAANGPEGDEKREDDQDRDDGDQDLRSWKMMALSSRDQERVPAEMELFRNVAGGRGCLDARHDGARAGAGADLADDQGGAPVIGDDSAAVPARSP